MFRHAALMLPLLAACAVDAESPAALATEAAPPPGTPAFVVGELFQGGDLIATWAELPPGSQVRVYASRNGVGTGPCPPVLQGACLEILPGLTLVGTATADARGVAQVVRAVPNLPGGTIAFQAVAFEPTVGVMLSNTFERNTGPTLCPFSFIPVCGWDDFTYSNDCLAHAAGQPVQFFDFCP